MLCLRGFKKDILLAWWSHLIIDSVFTFFSQIYCTVYINNIYIYISIYSKQWCHLSLQSLTRPIGSWAIRIFAVCAVVQCCFELDFFFLIWLLLFFTFYVLSKQMSYKLKCRSVVNHIPVCFSYSYVAIISVTFIFSLPASHNDGRYLLWEPSLSVKRLFPQFFYTEVNKQNTQKVINVWIYVNHNNT